MANSGPRLRREPIELTCIRCGSTFVQTVTGLARKACWECAPPGDRCTVEGCTNGRVGVGLCTSHYRRFKLYGDPKEGTPIRSYPSGAVCAVEGCDKPRGALEYCRSHYHRVRRHGNPLADVPFRDPNHEGRPTINNGGYRYITTPDGRRMLEHRYVMEQQLGRELLRHENVHHKNGDKLDNRPENLELWTVSQTPGQRVKDQLAWARQIIETYAPFEDWL